MKSLHLFIKGRVQGVSYRYFAQKKALELGLTGWVKNLADGRVEAKAFGDETDLKKFLDWCYQGPKTAQVNDIEIKWSDEPSSFSDFSIKH